MTIVRVSAPVPWPDQEFETWKVVQNPVNEKEQVWLSSKNRIKWCAPSDQATPTFEERTLPEQYEERVDIVDAARRLETKPEREWRRVRHGVATKDVVEEEKLNIKRSHYFYPEEEAESTRSDVTVDAGGAVERPVLPKASPVREDVRCAMDLRPFHDEEVREDIRCALDLRPFHDEEEKEDNHPEDEGTKVCRVGVSRVTDPNPNMTAEQARVICETRAEDVLMKCEQEGRAPTT